MYMYTLFKPHLFSGFIKTETNFFSYNLVCPWQVLEYLLSRQPTLNIVTGGNLSSPKCLEFQVVRKWASYILAAKGRVAQITADVTVAGVVIVVFTRWHFEMYKNTMGQIKKTTNDYWGCFLVNCVQ